MNISIDTFTRHAETTMKTALILFFIVHYGLLNAISRTAALILFATASILLAIVRFKHTYNHSQQHTNTAKQNSILLATIDALLITTAGIGVTIFASYTIVQSQLTHTLGLSLILIALLSFTIKRNLQTNIYGTYQSPV